MAIPTATIFSEGELFFGFPYGLISARTDDLDNSFTDDTAMTRLARAELLCTHFVRRCFLFGVDPVTGKNHDHRKVWIEDQLKSLAKYLGIDLLGVDKGRSSFSIIRAASAFTFLAQDLRRKASKRLSRRRLQIEMLENRRLLAFTAIVDNSNTQNFIKTGQWNTYTGIGYGGSVLISVSAGSGNATAEWNFNGLAAGNYRVSATWHGGSTAYTTAAPFTMLEGTTQVGNSTLNQRLDPNDFYDQGATWETIGIFSVNASLRVLTNNNSSAGLVVADAVRIEQVFSNSITGIVDNVIDSGYAKSGNWTLTNGVGYGGFYHRSTAPHEGSEWATWTILVDPGAYRVAVTWPQASATNGSNVQFNVYDSSIYVGGRPINQQVAPDDFFANGTMWESVGTFNIRSKLMMHVSDNANGFAIADAMRIERVSDTVVVDNLSPNFSKTGNWNTQNGSGYADSIYWSNFPHDGSETATWSFSVVPGTTYRIAGTWHEGNPVYGSNLPLQLIENGEVLQTIPISQRTSPNDFFENNYWWEFVTAYKTTSSLLQLKLSDSADGFAIADAFRLERVLSAVPFARDDFYETALMIRKSTHCLLIPC